MRFLTLLTLLFWFLSPTSAIAADWEQINDEAGVTVSRMSVEGSNLVAFKGETTFQQPVRTVLHVLLDNEHRIEWVGRLYTNHVIESESDFDYVLYQAFELPAIFSDRDYVYHGVCTEDAETGIVTLGMQSIEHPEAPETVGVRAELLNSRYVLTPSEDGASTHVVVEIHTDPKGMMPAWLTNMIQKDWPVDTLNGIRGQFGKDHMGEHALPLDAEREAAKAAEEAAKAAEAAAEAEAAEGEAAEGEEGEAAEGEEGEAAEGEATEGEATEGEAAE